MEQNKLMLFLEYIFDFHKKHGNILCIHDAKNNLLKLSVRNKQNFRFFTLTSEFMEDMAICDETQRLNTMNRLFEDFIN